MDSLERLVRRARELEPRMRERLSAYVHHETPTGDADALNRLGEVLGGHYAELGATVTAVPCDTGDHLLATWPAGDADGDAAGTDGTAGSKAERPHVVVLGHHDTVWPVGRLAEQMPYVDDGTLIRGPGVFDMKGGLVAFETAIAVLRDCDVPPAQPVRLVVTADEEIGTPTGRALVERELTGAAAALGLEPPHPKGGLKTGRHGSTRVRLEVTGVEAHAALDRTRGVSAIDELVDQLVRLRGVAAAEEHVLYNVGTVHGGSRTNVTAGKAGAELGFRFGDAEVERRVLDQLTRLEPVRENAGVQARILTSRPAWAGAGNEDLFAAVVAAGERVGQQVRGSHALGAADTNFAGAAGVPALDGFGPRGRGAHAVHEEIVAESLVERAALIASVLASPLTPRP
ncbi:M20/M25/M40 family metallo-hydrolase [Actinopolymorpha rutila]|uniref:Glutamate carboxypeptidase n=1 Tax=Actinopolymorpha rutila TaxID=446787 RepID=A0A852Z8K1_9ACTN|nr:M20/M25/M40 family metallo-hydrolase [Actinopolymorpha rutila]NYH89274.1 glutamate carboxypeptidase [Actinopolymorpha rutila]